MANDQYRQARCLRGSNFKPVNMRDLFYTPDGMEVTNFALNKEATEMVERGEFDFHRALQEALEVVEPAPEEIMLQDAQNTALLMLLNETVNKLTQLN